MNFSYWERRTFLEDTDTLVVGGGLVGLSTAIYLKRSNPAMRVTVIDCDPFSGGASSKNAGFACFGSVGELVDDLGRMHEDEVFDLVRKRYQGLVNLRELLGDEAIGYEPCGGYELFLDSEAEWFSSCSERVGELNDKVRDFLPLAPYQIDSMESHRWPFRGIKGVIRNSLEGSIHPGKLLRSLRRLATETGVELLNGIALDEWQSLPDKVAVRIGEYAFNVGRLVICTNGFARQLLPDLDVRPARNQVIVTSTIPAFDLPGTFHMDRGFVYFREIDGRMLIGGFRHLDFEGEFTDSPGTSDQIQEALLERLSEILLPGQIIKPEYIWSGTMGLGASKSTIIQEVAPRVFCGVRMGGMGIAIGSLVGKELASIVY